MSAVAAYQDVEEHEVFVRSTKGKEAGTIVQLVSWMIDDASEKYQRLYQVEVGESVNIIFKFKNDEDSSEVATTEREDTFEDSSEVAKTEREDTIDDWSEVAMESEDTISVLCKHEHPYLDKNVWLETKGRMDSTFLTGMIVVLSRVHCRVAEKGILESK